MKIIGVAGGSGSGKTTFSKMLVEALGPKNVVFLAQDSYYIDQSTRFDHDGGSVNFDHPSSIDWKLLVQHLDALRNGQSVDMPIYDFATHSRKKEYVRVEPKPFVIVDGILIYVEAYVREKIEYKIFIQTSENVRFARRLKRDVEERGRTADGVKAQYERQVKPMHDQFVEPTAAFANQVMSGENDFAPEVQKLVARLKK